MIDIHATGPMIGDATYPYDVIMDRPYTVSEFVDEVSSAKHNWGEIRYTTSNSDRLGKSLCDYRHGKVIGEIDDKIAHWHVKKAWGNGGWSYYGFTLLIG